MLPDLLQQPPTDQEIGSVTADGASDTRKCYACYCSAGFVQQIIQKPLEMFGNNAEQSLSIYVKQRVIGKIIWLLVEIKPGTQR